MPPTSRNSPFKSVEEMANFLTALADASDFTQDTYDCMLAIEAHLRNSVASESGLAEDAERYRWFRNECDYDRKMDILELADEPHLLDHHIDKGRAGL